MVSNPNTREAEKQDKSAKIGINSVHTQELLLKNKMNSTTQQTELPTFSNNYQTDKLTATQWIQEVTKQKTEAAWTDLQTLTQIQYAFRGELTDWFYSLKLLEIDTTNYESVKAAFENDYKVIKSVGTESTTENQINQADEDGFITVRHTKNKQTCKYCKKQGHSVSNSWTLRNKNITRAEQTKLKQETQRSENKQNYICPISNSEEFELNFQKAPTNIQTQEKLSPEISEINKISDHPTKDTTSNSVFSLIRKTCIKIMCEKIVKINDVRSKQTSRPLIQLKTLPGMDQTWLYDTGAALTCISTETFRQISINARPTKIHAIGKGA